jgi:hypothetical protein
MTSSPLSHGTRKSATEYDVYREAQVACRSWSLPELRNEAYIESLNVADPNVWGGDVGWLNASERLRAYEEEVDRRARILAMQAPIAQKYHREQEAWDELRLSVKQRVPITEVLELLGYAPRMIGRELHGPCPVCRTGDDRRLVREEPEGGRCWCRVCGLRADVIGLVRQCIPSASGYHAALEFLDDFAVTRGAR